MGVAAFPGVQTSTNEASEIVRIHPEVIASLNSEFPRSTIPEIEWVSTASPRATSTLAGAQSQVAALRNFYVKSVRSGSESVQRKSRGQGRYRAERDRPGAYAENSGA